MRILGEKGGVSNFKMGKKREVLTSDGCLTFCEEWWGTGAFMGGKLNDGDFDRGSRSK